MFEKRPCADGRCMMVVGRENQRLSISYHDDRLHPLRKYMILRGRDICIALASQFTFYPKRRLNDDTNFAASGPLP